MAKKYDFMTALQRFRCDPTIPEKAFHRQLKAHLEDTLSGGPLLKIATESGLQGSTTRLDLYAVHGASEYLISVKRGISAQKVKVLTGEVQEILRACRPSSTGAVVVAVVIYGEVPAGGDDHLLTLGQHLAQLGNASDDIYVTLVLIPAD
jgi:hypothetical protein